MKKVGVAEPSALSAPGQNEGGGSGSAARPANRRAEPAGGRGGFYIKNQSIFYLLYLFVRHSSRAGERACLFNESLLYLKLWV